jgi:hypothetical protein
MRMRDGATGALRRVLADTSAGRRFHDVTTSPHSARVLAGQAIYRPWTLPLYDLVAFKVNCRFLFRVPVSEVAAMFSRNVTTEHLDVGVGTGYFLDNCTAPRRSVTLADLNEPADRTPSSRNCYSP